MVRGTLINTRNRFARQPLSTENTDAIDEWISPREKTQYIEQEAKSLVNKTDSPNVGMSYNMNPYSGCEHGCMYCYTRNSHAYSGYSAGLDLESKIIVKTNAPQLLRKFLSQPKWEGQPITLSGNSDCYQPAEKKYQLTRKLLEICDAHNQPVRLITKNGGILRDKDILQKLAKRKLTSVMVSITSMDESLRQKMEPRTTTAEGRLRIIRELSEAGVPAGVIAGPVIPGLNDHQLQKILWNAAASGASFASYTFVRLNGAEKDIFQHWLQTEFPEKAEKVWRLIEEAHGGQVNDSRLGGRMTGEGTVADIINQQYRKYCQSYRLKTKDFRLNSKKFCVPGKQLSFF